MITVPSDSCSLPRTLMVEKPGVEPVENDKPEQNFVTCIHRVELEDMLCNITVTWAKTLMNHSLYITAENPQDEENYYTCKIDLKTWQFWGKKGLKTFTVAEKRVDVFWDLRSANFTTSPEPKSDYYVAMVSNHEIVLLLGDQKNEALRRTKSRPSSEGASMLVHKKEIVFAKKCFCTKTTLGQEQKEHSIMIESSLHGPYDPEMWISVDGIESIRVTNLHWRFRGNETIAVDNSPVQILWDVHDWLYNGCHSGVGIFVFRACSDVGELENSNLEDEEGLEDSCNMTSLGFCHFVYAWKTG